MDFKKKYLWDKGTRYCKLHKRMSKNGEPYYQADMGNFLLTTNLKEYTFGDKTHIELRFIPIEFEKQSNGSQQAPRATQSNVDDNTPPW